MKSHWTKYTANLFAITAAAAMTLAISTAAKAETAAQIIKLDSKATHGGTQTWTMVRQGDERAAGAAVSTAGFSAPKWQPAIVPGTVLNSLVANGVYPEPYFGLNNAHEKNLIPDLSETGPAFYTYWFRTEFNVPDSYEQKQVWMQFDGINYRAEIWLNGRHVGDMAGMFARGIFDITQFVKIGAPNALAVLVRPVDDPGGFKQKGKTVRAAGENRNGGDGVIGRNTTMLMSVGWDFTFTDGIRDRNTGLWRGVKLFATGPVALRNAFVQSKLPLPALAPARETISVDVTNATDKSQNGKLTAAVKDAGIRIEKNISLMPFETRTVTLKPEEYAALTIASPRLWWPMNKGEQFLHALELEFTQQDAQGTTVSDRVETRFGIREISSNRETPDKSRQFLVNGRPYYLHGTNWIPEAMCRTSRERTEAELRYTRQSGVNFLRLWGGGIDESDDFYDICDELGILVWNEFWQTGDTQLPVDRDLYRANVTDSVLRLRNHASLAYYCSANERPGSAGPNTKVDPNLIVPVKDIIARLDPTRGWQQSSEADGVHDGSPYVAENPMFYYEDTGSPRGSRINGLCPEYGCPILPTVDCLREMMSKKDLWPINKTVWDYLDGGGFHGMTGNFKKCVDQYGASSNIEEFAMKSQAFGGLAYRAIWEVWNANKFDYGDRFCTGVLFWYHNSPNRQVCGRMWDWSLEPTAALYFTQNALEPLHAQFDFLKNNVSVNNEFPRAFKGRVTARVIDFKMKEISRQSAGVNIVAEGLASDVLTISFPENISNVHFIKLELADEQGRVVSQNFYWRSNKEYKPKRTWTGPQYEGFEDLEKLPAVKLDSDVKWSRDAASNENVCTVTVKNPSQSLAFMVWLRLQNQADAKPVRPAFYDDNFFSLLPGESRTVQIKFADRAAVDAAKVRLLVDGWNVKSKTTHNR